MGLPHSPGRLQHIPGVNAGEVTHAHHALQAPCVRLRAGTRTLPGYFHGVLRTSPPRCPAGARRWPGGCKGARRGRAQTHSRVELEVKTF